MSAIELIAAETDDRLVERDVRLRIFRQMVGRLLALEFGEQRLQALQVLVATPPWSRCRADMLSSAAQTAIISRMSAFVFFTTKMPRRGLERTKPSCSRSVIASRTGVRLMARSCDRRRSSKRISSGIGINIHLGDRLLQRLVGEVPKRLAGIDRLDPQFRGRIRPVHMLVLCAETVGKCRVTGNFGSTGILYTRCPDDHKRRLAPGHATVFEAG